MGVDFRYPKINEKATDREQLTQIRSYLHQLVDQLQWAMNTIDTAPNSSIIMPTVSSGYRASGSGDGEVSFANLKSLIIKSADIIDAYYGEINKRLEGVYVAQSDFGTYQQKTAQDITATSTRVEQVFTNVQSIETNLQDTKSGIGSNIESLSAEVGQIDTELEGVKSGIDTNLKAITDDVGELDTALQEAKSAIDADIESIKGEIESINVSLVEVNAHIHRGLLYYDDEGIPVYGLEIGQKNVIDGVEVFNKYARFTAGRLSFYDQNGAEVAYISDYKLYITHAEVTGTLKLGGYLVGTKNGLTFKWVGRG
jgi:uncharacterized phage infection (PIP) family protein YhgE